jgi:hypothetical protein
MVRLLTGDDANFNQLSLSSTNPCGNSDIGKSFDSAPKVAGQ